MSAFFLALIFGQMVQATHRFDYPVYVVGAVLLLGCLLWLAIDAEKQLPEIGEGGGFCRDAPYVWDVLRRG
jgi:hypothetical protein